MKGKRVFLKDKGFVRGHWKVVKEETNIVWVEGKNKCSSIEKNKVGIMKEIYLR